MTSAPTHPSPTLASAVSSDGTAIAYRVLGDPAARPLVLIHGWAQSSSSWGTEVLGDLAQRFRVVAIDLRGHGHSDVPADGYDSARQWADDVEAVLDSAGIGEDAGAILLGWSYGGVVVSDYLAARGEGRVDGIVLCGAVTSLSRSAGGAIGPAMKEVTSGGAFDEKPSVALAAFTSFGKALMRSGSGADGQRILGLSLSTPPAVRQALLTRKVDNDDTLRGLTIPALVLHGAHDGVVLPSAGRANAEMIPGGRYVEFAESAHAPFLEDRPRFLAELDDFAASL
ncbi:alpha/beta fold hydrolase [Dietzia kunjamensis]|uniref:alpha/beta fold hydrolase n=1 Tax=Dietzia kunjamensis TaxID=322509 RepID=UPI00209787F2|nr:alpha/beta hydrolase [Dietzia kunjamensis]USX45309.1 alpha/beta hydrolase [Dietzia kunjamensis]